MKLIIKRKSNMKSSMFYYQNDSITGEYNFTAGLLLRKIEIKNNDVNTIVMKQKSILKKMFFNLLYFVFNPSVYPNFYIYSDDRIIGSSKYKFFANEKTVTINNDIYTLQNHYNNCISVLKNDSQVALFQRGSHIVLGEVDYTITCDQEIGATKDLLMLLVMYADIAYWYTPGAVSLIKVETAYGTAPHPERTLWQPED